MFRRFVNRNRAGVSLTRNSLAPPIPNNPKQTTILTFHYPLNRVLLHNSPNILSNEERVLILIYPTYTVYYIYYAENTVACILKTEGQCIHKEEGPCTHMHYTVYTYQQRVPREKNTVLVLLITDACTHTYYTVYTYQQRVYFLTSPSRLPRPPSWTTPTYYLLPVRRAPVLIPCLTLMTQRML